MAADQVNLKIPDLNSAKGIYPHPNVLCIEVLPATELNRYLSVWSEATTTLSYNQRSIAKSIDPDSCKFYGIMQDHSNILTVTSTWGQPPGGGMLSGLANGVAKYADVAGANSSTTGGGGFGGFIKNAFGGGRGSLTVLGARQFFGMGFDQTGVSTMKHYSGSNIVPTHSIKVSWYLPQSMMQAITSIKILLDMIYPRSAVQTNFNTDTGTAIIDALKDSGIEITNSDIPPDSQTKDYASTLVGGLKDIASKLISTKSTVNEKLSAITSLTGTSFVYVPLPVKISIGTQMAITPAVLTNATFTFSSETFFANGTLLPEVITADISFDLFMQPNPADNQMELLGLNLFTKTPRDLVNTSKDNSERQTVKSVYDAAKTKYKPSKP